MCDCSALQYLPVQRVVVMELGRLTYKGHIEQQWNSHIALQQNKVAQFKNQYQQETATHLL